MKSKLGLFSNGSISSSLFLMETNLIRLLFFIFFLLKYMLFLSLSEMEY